MKKITNFIVEHCYLVLAVMVALAGISAFASTQVKINHDIMQYMPADSETRKGLDIMDEEFKEVATSNYTLMFENLDASEKESIKTYIENVDGVDSVAWENNDDYNVEKDGKNYTLYTISVKGDADAENAARVYNEIHNHFEDTKNDDGTEKYTFYEKGDVASSNGTVLNIAIIIIAVLSALLIITIMSESFIEPILYLTSILIAVVINKGTNVFFPNVSHITDAIAAILQMALSMDYSIMLAHRYRQERANETDKNIAMKRALSHSLGSISASSITTIVGLIVLVFMSFTIGRDMGFVLSKGVLLSLISIFTTLPAFLLLFDKVIMNSKKKAPHFNMEFFGKVSYAFRHFALPAFAIILVGSMICKGNVGIDYTSSANDQIKEVFEDTNQIAIIYKNEDEARLAKICKQYEDNESVKQVLCFGNTIGEQKKFNEMKKKASDLGSAMDVDDYLVKTLYYHYYNPNEKNSMTLEEFVLFIQNNLANNPNFKNDISSDMLIEINRLSNFVVKNKMNQEKTLSELAKIFEMDESSLRKVFVLYGNNEKNSSLGKQVTNSKMTLSEFVNFISNKVLKDPEYSKEINATAKAKIEQLKPFLNKNAINKKMSAAEIANILGIPKTTVENVYLYEAKVNYMSEHGAEIAQKQAQAKQQRDIAIAQYTESTLAQKVAEMNAGRIQNGLSAMNEAEEAAFRESIKPTIETAVTAQVDASYNAKLQEEQEKVKNDIYAEAANIKNSPIEFVNFLLEHQNDDEIKANLNQETKGLLKLAKTVMDAVNTNKKFTYEELAKTFGLDASQLRLLYSLNYFENQNKNPKLSVKALVDFLNKDILKNEKYASALNSDQKTTLAVVTDLMNFSLQNKKYTAKQMYSQLSSLSNNLKSSLIDMLYMYYGSLYDYNDEWTMSLEQFVNYLHGTILKDKRFDEKIDSKKRDMINKADDKIKDAKKMLVGEEHSRAIFNTRLEPEGDKTFGFIETLKQDISTEEAEVYVIGNSPMALEMSKTFGSEMDFITILTMVSIFIVVALTFKSVIIPLILVLIIQAAVWITMSILSFTGSSVYFIALIIVQAILMGATIDYAILYTSYYLENRKKQKDTTKELYYKNIKAAIIESYNKSIHTIITSASVLVIVTFIVGKFDEGSAIAAKICTTISEGTLCAAIVILLILPALLASCDKIIIRKKTSK